MKIERKCYSPAIFLSGLIHVFDQNECNAFRALAWMCVLEHCVVCCFRFLLNPKNPRKHIHSLYIMNVDAMNVYALSIHLAAQLISIICIIFD